MMKAEYPENRSSPQKDSAEHEEYIRYFDLYVEDEEEYRILKDEVSGSRNAHYLLAGKWESCDCEMENGGEWRIVGVQKNKIYQR